MAVNHLAHMLLVDELYSTLQATEKSRIINVSSEGHKGFPGFLPKEKAKIDLNDIFDEKEKFEGIPQYMKSKLANVLFTRALSRVVAKEPNGMKTASLHPGTIGGTGLFREMNWLQHFIFITLMKPFYMTEFEGAQNNIMTSCVNFMKLQNGIYYDGLKAGKMNPYSDPEDY